MGMWNTGLFSNDITCDVKDTYIQFLKQQFSNEDAYQKTFNEYSQLMGTDEEPLFWYALADTQWNVGRLIPKVKDTALKFIAKKGGVSLWEEHPNSVSRWEETLQKLKAKVESPMPSEKTFKRLPAFVRNPWNIGDVYAYLLHTEKAIKYGVFGKYILFQKLGDVEYYEDTTFSVIQIFDQVFESLPTLEMLEGIRILPLVNPPNINGSPNNIENYLPSFEWHMKATMLYERKSHYPKKYLTFIGNKDMPKIEFAPNDFTDFFLSKDSMEDWLIEFYLNWQNIEY